MAGLPADAIVVAPDPSPTPKRSGRVVRPATKVRDTARQLEDTAREPKRTSQYPTREASNDNEADRASEPKKGSSSNDGKAMLLRALELLDESRTEMKELKEAIIEQNEIITKQQDLIQELLQRTSDTQREVRDTREELKQAREQLEAIATRVSDSPQLSYAEVARSPPSSQPSNIRTLSTGITTPSNFTDTLYCTIDTSRIEDGQDEQVTAGAIRALAEGEVRAEQGNSNWRCRAVTLD